jgi:hypothetical protein
LNIIPNKKNPQHRNPISPGFIIKQNLTTIKEDPITCTTKYLNALSDSAELPPIKMGIMPKKPTSIAHHKLSSPLEETNINTLNTFTRKNIRLPVEII